MFMNENGLCLMEIDDFHKFEKRAWHELWTDECRDVVEKTVEMAQRGETGRFEGFCPPVFKCTSVNLSTSRESLNK